VDLLRNALSSRSRTRGAWIDHRGLMIGFDAHAREARIPFGERAGSHTLVVGATGSGKTVTQSWIAVRAIEHGHAAIVVDPKGDLALRTAIAGVARSQGRAFLEWSPDGPTVYNPYGEGADTEIADKALAAERYTEPHYLRQAQRYLGHAVRAMRAARMTISPRTLVRYLDPLQLEILSRKLPEEDDAREIWTYLDSLSTRQQRDLAGTRDRLAVLAESDVGKWLDPERRAATAFDLEQALRWRAVVLFRLDADRRPLVAQMLGAAIVQDLLATAARHQVEPIPTLIVIDEFSALLAPGIARLFARTRAAGMSLVLGTQELSDLRVGPGAGILDQVLGNIGALVAHRQVVPHSAELVAGVAGSRGTWVSSQHTRSGLVGTGATASGNRTRAREYLIEPDEIKRLAPGNAAVVVPAGADAPRIVQIMSAGQPASSERRAR
jgi:type IV secretory pathway TraG/TraD family ATPase VirD4